MITPMDIHNKTFSRKLRGYAEDEVNSFLEEVVSDYERIYREHREMEEQMDTLKTKLANYEKMEATMSSTLVMAQETAENVKKSAHKEAELIIREAQAQRKQIIADAEEERRRMNAAVLKTEGDMKFYLEKVQNNLQSALNMVEAVKSQAAPKPIDEPKDFQPQLTEEVPAPAEAPAAPEAAPAEEAAAEAAPADTEAAEAPAEETPAAEEKTEESK